MGVLLNAGVTEPGLLLVVSLGLGVVFVGLLGVILVCKILALVGAAGKGKKTDAPVSAVSEPEPVSISGELAAVIGCAIAEELGTDVSAIRIVSIKKI